MAGEETTAFQVENPRAVDRDWGIVAACAVCLMLSVGTLLLYSFGVFVRPLASTFHWTRTAVSGALTVGQLTVGISAPLAGWLIDRFGPRKVIVPAIVGMSLAYASLAWMTPHVWHLYIVFALFTLMGGASSPVGYGSVLVRNFNRHLGLALGLSLMGIGLGAAALPPAAQWLVSEFGWRHAYAVIGLATLIITVPAALFATRHAKLPAAALTHERVAIGPLMATRAFVVMCIVFTLLGLASGGTLAHLVPMLVDRGFTPPVAAKMAGLAGLAVIAGRGGIGWLLDRINAARLLACVALLLAAALLMLLYAHSRSSSYAAALLIGSVLGAEVDFTAYLIRRYFGNAAFGRLYGAMFGIFAVGVGLGPLMMGRSFDKWGGYHVGLLLSLGFCLAAAAGTFALPRYERK